MTTEKITSTELDKTLGHIDYDRLYRLIKTPWYDKYEPYVVLTYGVFLLFIFTVGLIWALRHI